MTFPWTLLEFEKQFSSDEACRAYLEKVRWPDGFICPQCSKKKAWQTARGTYFCQICHRQSSVTAGTVFHHTKLPLSVWFGAVWLMVGDKGGISSLGCKQQLGLKRYETTWRMLKKLRLATVRPDRELLSGQIEVDETFVGGNKLPKGTSKQRALVIIAAQVEDRGNIGRIRMQLLDRRSSDAIERFVRKNIQENSRLVTDCCAGYLGLRGLGYLHQALPSSSPDPENLLPAVHRVASLLKRWLLGTYHGRVTKTHLDRYLEEFVFRFNRRNSTHRGLLFQRLIEQCLLTKPDTTHRRH